MAHSHECIDLIYEILTGSLEYAPSILRQIHSFPVDVADPSTIIFKVDALRTVIHGHIYGQFYWLLCLGLNARMLPLISCWMEISVDTVRTNLQHLMVQRSQALTTSGYVLMAAWTLRYYATNIDISNFCSNTLEVFLISWKLPFINLQVPALMQQPK